MRVNVRIYTSTLSSLFQESMEECIPLSDTGQCSRSPPGGDGEEAGRSLHPLPVTFTKVKRPQRGIVVLTELEESSGSSSLVRRCGIHRTDSFQDYYLVFNFLNLYFIVYK